jgi:hypothetical protein
MRCSGSAKEVTSGRCGAQRSMSSSHTFIRFSHVIEVDMGCTEGSLDKDAGVEGCPLLVTWLCPPRVPRAPSPGLPAVRTKEQCWPRVMDAKAGLPWSVSNGASGRGRTLRPRGRGGGRRPGRLTRRGMLPRGFGTRQWRRC